MRRSGVTTKPVLLVVALVACLSSCSHPAAPGTLAGELSGTGGMPPVIQTPFPGTIHVTGQGVDTQVPVGADGRFSLTLPAGTYTVVGHSPNLTDNGVQEECGAAPEGKPVTVTAGQTTTVAVGCSLR